jgi:hypothetical protein
MARFGQGGHDARAVAGADLGGILAVGDVERMWCRASMRQWPRIQSASWSALAWVTVRLVTA